eukprot:3647737-Rhodomonas_salina.3
MVLPAGGAGKLPTSLVLDTICLGARYAMSGTDIAFGHQTASFVRGKFKGSEVQRATHYTPKSTKKNRCMPGANWTETAGLPLPGRAKRVADG